MQPLHGYLLKVEFEGHTLYDVLLMRIYFLFVQKINLNDKK